MPEFVSKKMVINSPVTWKLGLDQNWKLAEIPHLILTYI